MTKDPPVTGRVLVALLPRPRDLRIAETDRWYRIRSPELVERLGTPIDTYRHIAFYQPAAFGPERFCIRRYAAVLSCERVRRDELLPHESDHPGAARLYAKLNLGPVELLPKPILSRWGRKVVFISTDWKRMRQASELNELFRGSALEVRLHRALLELGLTAEREYFVEYRVPGAGGVRRHYLLDFALFCAKRNLNIETDGDSFHTERKDIAADNERDNLLEANGWHVLRFNTQQVLRELDRSLNLVREAVEHYGGAKTPDEVIRHFGPDGRLLTAQQCLPL